jgi:Arc/MetJ-type ribon-helix-helix transcriptional regulator
MTVEFSEPEVERFVDQQVRSGVFPSADALVQEAVRRMMNDSDDALSDEDWEAIERADAQIERGEFVDFQTFAAEMRAKYNLK